MLSIVYKYTFVSYSANPIFLKHIEIYDENFHMLLLGEFSGHGWLT